MALTSTISNTITDPNGVAQAGVLVLVTLQPAGGFRVDDATEVARAVSTTTNASGVWSLALERNANITPASSYYTVDEFIPVSAGGTRSWNISVGASNQTVSAALVTPLPAAQASGFLTQAAADARYQALGSLGSGTPATSAVGDAGTAGVAVSASHSDHQHPREAFATPVATGNANAAGSATTVAHSDHVHKGVVAADVWTSYTPTLTQSGTVTKTVAYAKFMQIGKTVIVNVYLLVTGAGTGANGVVVGLPVAAAFTSSPLTVGVAQVFDQSAAINYPGIARISGSTTVVFVPSAQTAGNGVLGNAQFTAALANLDEISFSATYEAA